MVEIAIHQQPAVHHLTERGMCFDGKRLRLQDERLDLLLQRVAELEALGGEHLDAVVLERIVRCRDHDARVGVRIDRQIRHARRRDHAEAHNVAAAGRQARDERRLEHIRGNARVLADDDRRLPAALFGKRNGGSLPHAVRKVAGERFIHNAANAVGSE